MNGFRATAWRTHAHTDGRTWILRSPTTSSRDQKGHVLWKWSKMPKIEGFPHFFKKPHIDFPNFLVSRRSRWRPKDSRPYVRPCVRPYVTLLLENRSLLFSETLQLVRACKCEKNVPSAFLKKIPVSPILAKNCPKLVILAQNAQKWRFFAFFSESLHYFFLKLCS